MTDGWAWAQILSQVDHEFVEDGSMKLQRVLLRTSKEPEVPITKMRDGQDLLWTLNYASH